MLNQIATALALPGTTPQDYLFFHFDRAGRSDKLGSLR
jgi:hypothetical protein